VKLPKYSYLQLTGSSPSETQLERIPLRKGYRQVREEVRVAENTKIDQVLKKKIKNVVLEGTNMDVDERDKLRENKNMLLE
jgi:hypothetical protein